MHSYIILLFLASRLISFYFRYKNNEFVPLFPKIKIGEFKELPVYKFFEKIPVEVVSKVEAILSAKKANPQADTSALEAEIDQMVYALYGLSPAEIQMIEQSTL